MLTAARMNTAQVLSLVEDLEDNIADLDETLEPLLKQPLATTVQKLPVLDRAKLHVVLVYAIESLLFSYLRLQGTNVREHPIFTELARIKQYFEKIKTAEEAQQTKTQQPTLSLNKQAAGRILKHALAGNDKLDLERAEREAREKLLAKKKLRDLEAAMKLKAQKKETEQEQELEHVSLTTLLQTNEQMIVDREEGEVSDAEEHDNVPIAQILQDGQTAEHAETPSSETKKKRKRGKDAETSNTSKEDKAAKRARKQAKKQAKAAAAAG